MDNYEKETAISIFLPKSIDSVRGKPTLSSAFISGMFSGTCSTLLFQPLDLLKTRLQEPLSDKRPQKILTLAYHIIQNEKPTALWKGLVPSLWRSIPGVALYFTSLQYLENFLCPSKRPSPSQALIIGAFARAFTGSLLMPTTVIKSRFESGTYAYKSFLQAFCSIYKLEGIPGLFRGLVPTLLRDVPFSAMYYLSYTQCKQYLTLILVPRKDEKGVILVSAVVSGIWAATLTQPPDVIKTQMQLFPQQYNGSAIQACTLIYRRFGYKGFFRGLVPRLARRTLMSGVTWSLYEYGIRKIPL